MKCQPRKFKGPLEQLMVFFRAARVAGEWEPMPAGYMRFVSDEGAIFNWWPSTGTCNFQGPKAAAAKLERLLLERAATLPQQPRLARLD